MAPLFPKGNPGEKFPCMKILRRAEISNRAKAGKPGFGGRREGAPANLCLVFCPIPADAEGLWLEPAGLCSSVVTHSSLCNASQEQSGLCSSSCSRINLHSQGKACAWLAFQLAITHLSLIHAWEPKPLHAGSRVKWSGWHFTHSLVHTPEVTALSSRSRGGLAAHSKVKALAYIGLAPTYSQASETFPARPWTLGGLLDKHGKMNL